MAPGEMEQVILKKDSFGDYPDLKNDHDLHRGGVMERRPEN